jgi:hypothetical protein
VIQLEPLVEAARIEHELRERQLCVPQRIPSRADRRRRPERLHHIAAYTLATLLRAASQTLARLAGMLDGAAAPVERAAGL